MPVTRQHVHAHVSEDSHLDRLPRPLPAQKVDAKFPSPSKSKSKQKSFLVNIHFQEIFGIFSERITNQILQSSSDDENAILQKDTLDFHTNSDESFTALKKSNSMQPKKVESFGHGEIIFCVRQK